MNDIVKDFKINDLFSVEGKVVLVVGAGGLGEYISRGMAANGAKVIITNTTLAKAEKVQASMAEEGLSCDIYQMDVTDDTQVAEIVEAIDQKYGRIDVLINTVGIGAHSEPENYPSAVVRKVVDVNLNGTIFICREVGKVMIRQGGGKIINIGSALSYTADAMCPAYVTAKHGVIGITRSFANELGKYNIQCNAVCPGFLATSVNSDVSDNKEYYDKITARIPADRWGRLDDLMGCMVFLASDASNYVNGADIKIDGGFSTTL